MQRVHQTPDLGSLRQTSKYKTDFLKADLERENLLMTGWAAWIGGSFGLFLLVHIIGSIFVMIVFASLRIELAVNPNILTSLWQGIGIVTFCCLVPSNRTRWGNWILADIKKNHDAYDVMQRFALYGYQALSGGVLDDLKQIFKAEAEAATGGCGCGC